MGKDNKKKLLLEKNWKELAKEKDVFLYDDHKLPVTRRDFLSSGLLGFSASMLPINLLSLLTNPSSALAAECVVDQQQNDPPPNLAPFMCLNLAGGAGLMMNFVPNDREGGVGGSFSGIDYSRSGLGSNPGANIITEFGNVPFSGGQGADIQPSQVLMGIRATASATTLANTAFIGMPSRSGNDTDQNLHDVSGLVTEAGRIGQYLPIFASNGGKISATGLNQLPTLGKAPSQPSIISNVDQISSALGSGGGNGAPGLNGTQRMSLFQTLRSLSGTQLNSLAVESPKRAMASLIDCAAKTNENIVGSAANISVDPRQDAQLQNIWGINANSSGTNRQTLFAGIANSVVQGYSPVGNLYMGGYDYHNGTRSRGDDRDRQAGEIIGRLLETAAAKGQKLFLYVSSDGSVDSNPNSDNFNEPYAWSGDRGSTGGAYILAFDPAGRPATSGYQINRVTASNSADRNGVITNAERGALAVFANYLQFTGQLGLFGAITGNAFSSAELDRILMIA